MSEDQQKNDEDDGELSPRFYDDLGNLQSALGRSHSSDNEEEAYCERTPLLNSDTHSRPVTPSLGTGHGIYSGLSRSISVHSVSGATESSSGSSSDVSVSRLTSSQKKVLVLTAIADLLAYLSLSIMAPFFPEEALSKGISDTLSGWIFGTQPFVQFLISPIFGKLLPYAGVKFTFLAGQFLSGGCTVLFGLMTYVPTDDGYGIFLLLAFSLQIFKSVGTCATSTSSFVLLAEEFDNIATVFGIGEVFVGLGLVVGPAVGGLLYGQGGFILPFAIIGGLSLVMIPVMWWFLPEQVIYVDSGAEKISFTKVLCSTKAIITSLAIVVSTFSWSILDPTLEPHLRKFELSPELIGVIFLVMAAAYAVSSPLWGWVADKMTDQRSLLIVGFLVACIGSLLIGPSPLIGFDDTFYELWLIIVALVILGASISLSSIPTFNQYFVIFEDLGFEDDTRTYGMVAGLWMSMYSLGDFLGPSVGGFLLDSIGFNEMCNYTAGLCLAMAALVAGCWIVEVCFCKKKEETKKDEEQGGDYVTNNKAYGINDGKCLAG